MTNINTKINELETKLGLNLPADIKKCLHDGSQEQLTGKCFYHTFYGSAMINTITCLFSVPQILSRELHNANKEYLRIGIAGGNDLVIGLKGESFGKIYILFQEEYYKLIAESFNNFAANLIDKDDILASDTPRRAL